MLAKLKAAVSRKAVSELEPLLEAFNREVVPVLAAVRDAINEAIGEETRYSLLGTDNSLSVGGAIFTDIDTPGTTIKGVAFDIDDFPAESLGRARAVYFRVIGYSSSSNRTMRWQLYDATGGAAVADSECSTNETTPYDMGLIGPVSLSSGRRHYYAQARTGGPGATALTLLAEVVIRYE